MKTLLICGGRDYDNQFFFFAVASRFVEHFQISKIISGGATGADTLAETCAIHISGVDFKAFRADWKQHGKSAGPIRNAQMLREGKPDYVLAFPGGKGTQHMVDISIKAGVPTIQILYDGTNIQNLPTHESTFCIDLIERYLPV